MPPPLPIRLNALQQLVKRASTTPKPRSASIILHPARQFTSAPLLWKKKDRQTSGSSKSKDSNDSKSPAEPVAQLVDDPFDLSSLETGISKSLEKLGLELGKLRTGGRFNPEVLEGLRVQVVKDGKSERLGDLAQVLPKGGRSLVVLVGESDHVKPITSAIQSADLNLTPQPDAHNPSQLNVPIPSPTKESRDAALAAAGKTGEIANLGVKNARAAMQKRLRVMELRKSVRPDDMKKAHKEMEKVVENAHGQVKKVVDAAKKTMEQA